jgi:hypothetical protein
LQEDKIVSAHQNEKEAVRTTIVGGRPPGSGRDTGVIPRGIEVLVKKAAVDPDFRELLFEQRGRAAAAIELDLDTAEDAMLNAIPQEQLAQIVSQTTVPVEQRRVFLGRLALAMLAVLGAGLAGCKRSGPPGTLGSTSDRPPRKLAGTRGIQPDRPLPPPGIQPDLPATNSPATNQPPTTNSILSGTNLGVVPTTGIRPDIVPPKQLP